MTRKVAWLDAQAGVAGDMLLGALVDAGLDVAVLERVVEALGLEDVELEVARVQKGPLVGTKVTVLVGGEVGDPPHPPGHGHRTLGEIVARIRAAEGLDPRAAEDAVRVFELLAAAEGAVHGHAPEDVHFHEVGAADALVDIVGACAGLRHLGVEELSCSALPWSTGTIQTDHGALPLPPPAVVRLLEGLPTQPSEERREQVTPTGAALVRALARGTLPPAGFVPHITGTGAGTQEGERLPNVVRLVVGEIAGEDATPAEAVELAANLDDATGQEVAHTIARALAEGALDAWASPVTMKKGRPGVVVSVLVRPADVPRLERVFFAETPTLGVRRHAVARTVLARRHAAVGTPWGEVRMKVRDTPTGEAATPEHDDVQALCERHGVSFREVAEAARAGFARRAQDDASSA